MRVVCCDSGCVLRPNRLRYGSRPMKFRISATSTASNGEKPCIDARPDGEIEQFGRRRRAWAIDVADLDDLLALADRNGPLILHQNEDGQPEIEIYDDYRE